MQTSFSELSSRIMSGDETVSSGFLHLSDLITRFTSRDYLLQFHSLQEFDEEKQIHLHYSGGIFEELLGVALAHYNGNVQGTHSPAGNTSRQEIHIVHPFWPYLALSFESEAELSGPSSSRRERFRESLGNFASLMDDLISDDKIRERYKIIIRDFPEMYLQGSAFLLEESLVDDIIFTGFLRGWRLFPEDLSNKSILYAGAYVGQCVDSSIVDDQKHNLPWHSSYIVSDLLLHPPDSAELWIAKWYGHNSNPDFSRPLIPENNIITYNLLKTER